MWPWPLIYLNKVSNEQLCQIILISMHKCRSYGPDKLNVWPFYHLTFKCDLDLQLSGANVSNEQLCQISLNSMHKCKNYGMDKLNLWPFYHLTFKCDLDLQPTRPNASNDISTPQVEQVCLIILKFIHKCRRYGQDKLNLQPFYHLTFKCKLDLQPPWRNVSNGTVTPRGE